MENNLSVIAISEIKYTKELYKKMYNRVLKKERIIYLSIILILIFITLAMFSFGKFKIINFCLILILMISLIIFFRKKDIKINKKINKASLTDTKSTITFYESYLDIIMCVNEELIKIKYEYININKILDDKNFIYLVIDKNIFAANKEDINFECSKKLNYEFFREEKEYKTKCNLNFLFAMSFISVYVGLIVIMICIILFNIPGFPFAFIEYSWIFFLLTPVPIFAIVLSFKRENQKYKSLKKLIIVSIILLSFLVCGLMPIIKKENISHSFTSLNKIEKMLNMDFPSKGRIRTALYYNNDVNKIIMIKFKDGEKDDVLNIVRRGKWRDLQTYPEHMIDNRYLTFTKNYDYFCAFNVSNKSFNSFKKGDNMLYMAYNEKTNTLFIVDYFS